ncbi:MAG: aminotransferase class III-fold pyridoxal phosphate-dependent enzyme [Bacteroidetes bacterium]|nr:aminotransferase class III-fold pyridoxal phosphate-dependent enzyme [Bacteroidota bacterium]
MAHTNSEYIGPDGIIAKKSNFLFPCSYHFYADPPQIVSGSGTILTDSQGKNYVDFFAGVSVMSCGHCNEEINNRVIDQIRTLQHTTSIYLTQPVVELAERLSNVLPGEISRSFFCNSGSEANEGAMLLARVHTGKKEFIALKGSLHGRTYLTSGATEIPMWRTDPFLDDLPIHFAGTPDDIISIIRKRGDKIAALLVEPIQGNAGIKPLEADFFHKLGPLLKEKGILLISDEIQTGFGRTGKMFAIEHYPVQPDIITGAKALGNGFPIGFFAASSTIAASFTKPSASTLGGNPVSCQAALGVLDFIEKEELVSRADKRGTQLKNLLIQLSSTCPFLEYPRGMGLMLGTEVSAYKDKTAPEITDIILEKMKNSGYLIGKNGLERNVLAFQPPLIISSSEIESMVKTLKKIIMDLS